MNQECQNSSSLNQPTRMLLHSTSLTLNNSPQARPASSRKSYRWSKAAREMVRENLFVRGTEFSALIDRLVKESGAPRWTCRRFAHRMGIPMQRQQRSWTTHEQLRLIKLIDLHPVNEIARLMRRSQSSICHMLYRLGANAQMGKDSFTKYTLATALHVQTATIEAWIARGWLKAREIQAGAGKRVIIEAEDFCQFCRKHTRDVVGTRLRPERLDFVYRYAFTPSHADLLPVRESKKERTSFKKQAQRVNLDPREELMGLSRTLTA